MVIWTPELRELQRTIDKMTEVKCSECPFFTEKKSKPGGWCFVEGYGPKTNISARTQHQLHYCFTHARLVLKMPV